MPTKIDGSTGVDKVVDGSVTGPKIADGGVTPGKLSGGQSGSAPVYGCRAWCNFDGTLTGTNAPRAGGNVASVTRNSVGDYTINFTTAMQDANYSVSGSVTKGDSNNDGNMLVQFGGSAATYTTYQTPTSVRALTRVASSFSALDSNIVTVQVFR